MSKKTRNTEQRKIILKELQKMTSHPTAFELFKKVQKRMPDIGLATIYRTLDFMEKKNKIIKLKSKDKEARYDGRIDKHCHLICKGCSFIADITDVKKIIIKSEQLKRSGFTIDPTYVEMFGVCKKCSL